MHDDRPVILRECGPLFGGYGMLWRAYGVTKADVWFMLSECIGGVHYPLERDTEKQLRRVCVKRFHSHPIVVQPWKSREGKPP